MGEFFKVGMVPAMVVACSVLSPVLAGEISPRGHEPIKASIIDDAPERFTIDVMSLANVFADEEAKTFAVYISTQLPQKCADFSRLNLAYEKPEKYLRQFDLSKHKDVLAAIDHQKCVIVRNVPSN